MTEEIPENKANRTISGLDDRYVRFGIVFLWICLLIVFSLFTKLDIYKDLVKDNMTGFNLKSLCENDPSSSYAIASKEGNSIIISECQMSSYKIDIDSLESSACGYVKEKIYPYWISDNENTKRLLKASTNNLVPMFSKNLINIINLFTILAFIIGITFTFYFISNFGKDKIKLQIATSYTYIGVIFISFTHAIYIYVFGGISTSPFGIIATSIIPILFSQDLIRYYNNKQKGKSLDSSTKINSFWIFLPTIIFISTHLLAEILYILYGRSFMHEILVRAVIPQIMVYIFIVLSLILGGITINTRANDFA